MKEFIKKIVSSLDTHSKGLSARKLTAFAVMTCVIAAHAMWLYKGDLTNISEIFIVDYTFVAALLGLTTYQAIKEKQ